MPLGILDVTLCVRGKDCGGTEARLEGDRLLGGVGLHEKLDKLQSRSSLARCLGVSRRLLTIENELHEA